MAWVYILRGGNGRHYIGCTENLERRLTEHKRGSCHTTRRLGFDLSLVACSEVPDMSEARLVERRLKAMKNPAKAISFFAGSK